MTNKLFTTSFFTALAVAVLAGCTGVRTFHDHARAGDTIAVAAGWAHHLQRGNIEVTIVDREGNPTTYTPGQPGYEAVRGSINFYPDPVSGLVLSDRLGTDVTPFGSLYSDLVNQEATGDDRDWWETVVFVDLPDPMALGDATVTVSDLGTPPLETVSSIVTIVPNEFNLGEGGTPNIFRAKLPGLAQFNLIDEHFQSMERTSHYVVSVAGSTVPHAIQVDLTHDPDEAHGGTGTPYVVNPIGHIKNLSWAQTGTSGTDLRVIITPARDGEITNMNDFKFYVAGGINGLTVVDQDAGDPDIDVQAFDANGNTLDPVTEQVTAAVASMN